MHATQQAVLATLRAVQGFLDDKKAAVAPVNESGARKNLDDLVAQLTAQSIDQTAGRANGRGETARQARLREALRSQMKAIAAIAKAHLGDVPEMKALSMPPRRRSSTRLIADAGAMAEAAEVHKEVLVGGGLVEDFIPQLNAAAQALMVSVSGRTHSMGRATGATARLSQLEEQARKMLRVLDALVVPRLGLNEGLVREWKTVKAIQKKRGVPQGSTVSGSSPTSGTTPTMVLTPTVMASTPAMSGSMDHAPAEQVAV